MIVREDLEEDLQEGSSRRDAHRLFVCLAFSRISIED